VSTAYRDASGCLTPAGLAALNRAAPGQAPADLAQHVAGCGRCQDRLLASLRSPDSAGTRSRRKPPPLWRVMAVAFGLVLLGLLALLLAASRH